MMFTVETRCVFSNAWREIDGLGEFDAEAKAIEEATRIHWRTNRRPVRVVDDGGRESFRLPAHLGPAVPPSGRRGGGCRGCR